MLFGMVDCVVDFFLSNMFSLIFLWYYLVSLVDEGFMVYLLIFIAGTFFGGIFVGFAFYFARNNGKHFANSAIKEGSKDFLEQNRVAFEDFYKRFKEKIDDFERRSDDNFREEIKNFAKFEENINAFINAGNKISQDTNSLVRIMKSDNRTQGHWGEIVLERVLEASGLRKGEEYQLQCSNSEGRPDATVFLPENKCVYIDAKTSLASWSGFVNANNEEERGAYLKQFVESSKTHIRGLAKRAYSQGENFSPDYVLMFIPIEGCYSMMFCENCALWDFAWENKVMMLLEDLRKVRRSLNSALVKLSGNGNIFKQIEKIENLGVALSKPIGEFAKDFESPENFSENESEMDF